MGRKRVRRLPRHGHACGIAGSGAHGAAGGGRRQGRRGMKDKATVEAAIRDALEAVRPGEAEIGPVSELGLYSTQAMELVMQIEERLDISIPVDTLADSRTFDQLCAGIMRLD
jgi:acyl carrier protein